MKISKYVNGDSKGRLCSKETREKDENIIDAFLQAIREKESLRFHFIQSAINYTRVLQKRISVPVEIVLIRRQR